MKLFFFLQVLKIARAVELYVMNVADFDATGEIDYSQISDETLEMLHRFVLSNGEEESGNSSGNVVQSKPSKFAGAVVLPNRNSANVSHSAIVTNQNQLPSFNGHARSVASPGTIVASSNNNNRQIASSFSFYWCANYIKIELPSKEGQPKISYILTREKWLQLCSSILSAMEMQSNTELAGDRITEYVSDNDEHGIDLCDDGNSSDWDVSGEQLSPEELDDALYSLYHNSTK